MKKLAFAIIAGVLTLNACVTDRVDRDQIKECSDAGKVPYFSTNRRGDVKFISCGGQG